MKKHDLILFVLPKFSGGGAERVTLNLAKELKIRGHSVEIVVFSNFGPLFLSVPEDIPIHNLNTSTLRNSIIPLVRKVRALKPRVVFSTFGYINIALLATRYFWPKNTKIWIREANLPSISVPNNSYPYLIIILYRMLYKKADKLICSSKKMKSEFVLNFSILGSNIDILPNPVYVDKIRKLSLPRMRFDNGGVCYVASGRLTYQKGFDRLILWFGELDNLNSTLVILGDGELKKELIECSKLLKLHNRIKFLDFCDNPWQWYAGADVFLLSSRWEGMPNAALEALACGTSVISTEESGGIGEVGSGVVTAINQHEFIKNMRRVEIKNKNNEYPSLLPEKYDQSNSVNIIEEWLKNINTI